VVSPQGSFFAGPFEQLFVILTLDLQFFTKDDSCLIPNGRLYHSDRFQLHHFFSQAAELFSERIIASEVKDGHPCLGVLTGYSSHNASTKLHRYRLHWQSIDVLVDRAERRTEREPN
jgi:hypothetical protein